MKTIQLKGELRSDLGKAATRRVRSEGKIPAIIYGGDDSVHCTVEPLAVRPLIYTPEFQLAEVEVDGKKHRCIVKDLQFDVVTDDLIHIDFLELVDGKKVIAEVPLNFTGSPVGVKEGGRLEIKLKSVKVRTYPKYLAAHLDVDISKMEIGGNVRVQDIQVEEHVEVQNPPRIPVASVVTTRALRQAGSEGEEGEEEAAEEAAPAAE